MDNEKEINCLCADTVPVRSPGCRLRREIPNTSTTAAGGSETTAAADEGFYFELNGQKLVPGMAQDDMISAVGETDNVFSAPAAPDRAPTTPILTAAWRLSPSPMPTASMKFPPSPCGTTWHLPPRACPFT